MMAARPIIHGIETPFDVVEDARCGVSIPAEDPNAIAEAILKLKALPREELDQMGLNGHHYIKARYDYEILARKMEDIMQSVIAQRGDAERNPHSSNLHNLQSPQGDSDRTATALREPPPNYAGGHDSL